MKNVRTIRFAGMIFLFILLIAYLIFRSLPGADVSQLQFLTLFIGSIVILSLMITIYFLDIPKRKSTLFSIVLIIVIIIIALFIH